MTWLRPSPANKAGAARESAKANAKRRDLEKVTSFIAAEDRMPSRREAESMGIWFGPNNHWRDAHALADALGRPHTDGRAHRYAKRPRPSFLAPVRASRAQLKQIKVTDHRLRRCDGCDQLAPWDDAEAQTCPHCRSAWVRTLSESTV